MPGPDHLIVKDIKGNERNISVYDHFNNQINEVLNSSGYMTQLAHFANCIQNKIRPDENVHDGTRILRILIAGYHSAAIKKSVNISSKLPEDKTPIEVYFSSGL